MSFHQSQTAKPATQRRPLLLAVGVLLLLGACTSAESTSAPGTPDATDTNTPNADAPDAGTDSVPTICDGPRWAGGTDLVIFLQPGLVPADIAAVEATLAPLPLVDSYMYVGTEEAYREYQQVIGEIASDYPDAINTLQPEDIPTSFRLKLADGDASAASKLAAEYRQDDRVFVVVERPECISLDSLQVCDWDVTHQPDCTPPPCEEGMPYPASILFDWGSGQAAFDRVRGLLDASDLFGTIEFTDGLYELDDPPGFPAPATFLATPRRSDESLIDFLVELERDEAIFLVSYVRCTSP